MLTVSALLLGGTMVGCTAQQAGLAKVSEAANGRALALAAAAAAKARVAVAAHKGKEAVAAAEAAVAWQPQDAGYRALLGQSYLTAGRFVSARDAFADALTMNPKDGRVALNLALAQTAAGDWTGARKTLDDHADIIPAVDRGLAIALAGDPADAVQILTEVARAPGADAKARQNLALSLALAGRWQDSQAVASVDLGADQLDKRMQEWASFAYPKSSAQQVATLLGVTPVADQGQPAALALNATVTPAQTPVTAVAAVSAPEPAPVAASPAAEPQIAMPAVAAATPVAAPMADAKPSIVFAARQEVVQPLPAGSMAAAKAAKPATAREVSSQGFAKGNYFVQLGAYENAAVAHDGWLRATRRFPVLGRQSPQGMPIKANGVSFYRLSVGGFAKAEASALCSAFRHAGGVCFVREGQGDQIAQWLSAKRQLAMR